MARDKRYTFPIRSRLTEPVGAALLKAADRRDLEVGSLVRRIIEVAVSTPKGDLSPLVRRRRPIEHAKLLVDAVRLLGSVAGNLQRLYTMSLETRRVDDRELLSLKAEVATASRQLREAIGGGEDA